jgi:hypothetical protein
MEANQRPEDIFIISIATHDNRAVPKSVRNLLEVASLLKRPAFLNVQQGTGIANTRNKCMQAVRERFPEATHAYMFWLDSDIVIEEDPQTMADYVLEAEKRGLSFSGSYCIMSEIANRISTSVYNDESISYNPEVLKASAPFDLKLLHSGLGLCYIKMPLKYEFRTQGTDLEDLLFFRDNPEVDIRYVPISNNHIKTIWLPFR